MTIYLMRHGETIMNHEERLQGQIDAELNDTGIAEARKAAKIIAGAGIQFDRIYSSPLKRAMQTAEIVAAGKPVTVEPLITEMHFGSYEGMPYSRIDEKMWAFIHDPENVAPPEGVESIGSLTARTGRFLDSLISAGKGECVLAVTHGIALRSMLRNLCDEKDRHGVWGMPIGNCVMYRVDAENGRVAGVRKADELSQRIENDTSGVF